MTRTGDHDGEARQPGLARSVRSSFSRTTAGKDLSAGLVLGLESVPDGLAAGLLAGVNPVSGLYGYLVGTAAGAFATSSVFMSVQATGAMAVVIADVPRSARDPTPVRRCSRWRSSPVS